MNLSIDQFCEIVAKLNKGNAEKALAILWYFDSVEQNATRTAGQLTKILTDHHVGTPNQTSLAAAIRKSKLVIETKAGFSLRPGSRRLIRDWLPSIDGLHPSMDHNLGYLPENIWRNTRGYIEEVAREMNGCFRNSYYNAAAVMLRRLLETLIIEAYEYLNRESEIKDSNGNYLMLSELVDRALGDKGHRGLGLGRDSKKALKDARNIGNWSAHARRFLAHANDLMSFQAGVRVLAQELIQIANLVRK
jgi:hypothetical protein